MLPVDLKIFIQRYYFRKKIGKFAVGKFAAGV